MNMYVYINPKKGASWGNATSWSIEEISIKILRVKRKRSAVSRGDQRVWDNKSKSGIFRVIKEK